MRIPESKIEEVRSASDIVDVIAASVNLKKRGRNFLGLCPFHSEKTPSFTVSREKQMYHCFGCGVGGNVFTYVMETEKVSFVEAVRNLAERAGILLPEEGSDANALATENEHLFAACKVAARFFHDNMMSTVEGKLALEYFHHRGFTDETIRKFGLGYAMNAWDTFTKHTQSEKMDPAILEKAGLILRRDDATSYYDRFRGRAIFPIFSPSGRVIAFGARKMREDDPLGKYINSPETPIYIKSRSLYGIFQAREALREKDYAVMVEGYADLISVYQSGIKNIVASSGTALTEEQIDLIARYTRNVTLVYDGDSAGSKATVRGVDLIIEHGLDVKVAELPAGEDPDSFVRKFGGDKFQELLDGAASFLDFKATAFKREGLLDTPEGKARAIRSIVETIAKVKDEIKRDVYLRHVADKYDIYANVLYRELEKIMGAATRRSRVDRPRVDDLPEEPSATSETPRPVELPAAERDLIRLLVEQGKPMFEFVFTHLQHSSFTHPLAHAVVMRLADLSEQESTWDAGSVIDRLDDDTLRRFVAEIAFTKYDISKGWAKLGSAIQEPEPWKLAQDAVLRIRSAEIDTAIRENFQKMKEASGRGEPADQFAQQVIALQDQKKNLTAQSFSER